MREGRLVMIAFGVAALVMIAVPVATILTMTRPGPVGQGLDGVISRAFLASGSDSVHAATETVPAVGALLPRGLPELAVFQKLAASGFTCSTDSDAATCFRTHASKGCRDDWNIRVIFKDDGTVWSSAAERKTTCDS